MSEVRIAEAKIQLPRIVQRAESGKEVHTTRRGKPVAELLSMGDYARLTESLQRVVDFAQDKRKNIGSGLGLKAALCARFLLASSPQSLRPA